MESSVQRRLNGLYRHLQKSSEVNHQVLLLNSLRAIDELEYVGSEPVVIGGMVLDIHAKPSTTVHPRTTTPGKVHYVAGGVARNIAECMSKLGTKPFMISIVGDDMAGNLLMDYWKSAELDTAGIEQRQNITTPVVCSLFDTNGELTGAVASVEAIELFLTQEQIQKFSSNICSAPVVMIDANLNPSSLEASCKIAKQANIPVWFEPVSVAKSKRVTSIVSYVTITSPNEDELIAMANALSPLDRFCPIQSLSNGGSKRSIEYIFQMLKPAIVVLLKNGVKIVVVTLGADGVFVCSKDKPEFIKNLLRNFKPISCGKQLFEMVTSGCPSLKFCGAKNFELRSSHLYAVHFPSLPASAVRLTGAGDCLVGGTLASICAGLDVMQSIAVGIAAAKAAVEVESNVPSAYFLAKLSEDARLIYSLAKVVCDQPMI
ncbi:pfkB-like carbohydrate kinase family protein [Thalictrum thalictroides]|uniref:PfkB-like carbohydrate kinase family protein n=1 Tax=Thalictrum thalictroides TaxID=46969 RepID=A0A7J6WL21_THATH|nr:pfkB-like carbohydrate kinase family protein [Thalictrum thalictroides]